MFLGVKLSGAALTISGAAPGITKRCVTTYDMFVFQNHAGAKAENEKSGAGNQNNTQDFAELYGVFVGMVACL